MAESRNQLLQHRLLTRIDRRQADVATFTGDRHPPAPRRGEQPRHAQPGSRAQHRQRRAGHRCATTDLMQLARVQRRKAQRQRGEVIEHHQPLQAELALKRSDGEVPGVIGHLDLVAGDRGGDGKATCARRGLDVQAQVMPDGPDKRGVLVRRQDRHVRDRCAGLRLPAEAGIRAADVAEQAGKRRRHHVPGNATTMLTRPRPRAETSRSPWPAQRGSRPSGNGRRWP
jgi:hypothetical protein